MKVVYQWKNPFRRRLDNGGALDAEQHLAWVAATMRMIAIAIASTDGD